MGCEGEWGCGGRGGAVAGSYLTLTLTAKDCCHSMIMTITFASVYKRAVARLLSGELFSALRYL